MKTPEEWMRDFQAKIASFVDSLTSESEGEGLDVIDVALGAAHGRRTATASNRKAAHSGIRPAHGVAAATSPSVISRLPQLRTSCGMPLWSAMSHGF
ncbi:hypothetical protein [Lentzea roselyniae]|uniref:hypothetical protein n=1 Tax=Lentzea roselyniae TaxID=531940 RepID=UPI0031F94761